MMNLGKWERAQTKSICLNTIDANSDDYYCVTQNGVKNLLNCLGYYSRTVDSRKYEHG